MILSIITQIIGTNVISLISFTCDLQSDALLMKTIER